MEDEPYGDYHDYYDGDAAGLVERLKGIGKWLLGLHDVPLCQSDHFRPQLAEVVELHPVVDEPDIA